MSDKAVQDEPLISVRNLSKGFDGSGSRIEILTRVNFDIYSGETLAVVGPSGIGKTTFLHILGTLDRPDSGKVFYRGEDVFRYGNGRLAEFRNECVGFIFQFHHLLPEFTALENIMLPSLIHGESKKKAKESAEHLLERVGLMDRASHRVGSLSGGEQQRIALARALIQNPVVLLADEPTGNLDKKNGEAVHHLLFDLNREMKMTLVVVTHNPEFSALMSRKVTITDGKIEETREHI